MTDKEERTAILKTEEAIAFCNRYLMECDTKKYVLEMLEKQIPRKPNRIEPITINGGMWVCPVCGKWLRERLPWYKVPNPNFCVECGQAIQWEEE